MIRLHRFAVLTLAALLTLALSTTAFSQHVRNPLPVPDVEGFKTLKCDFHLHTVFSDGRVWPTVRVIEAYRQGLDVIALTDHDDYHPWAPHVSEDLMRPHELAKPMADELGIILIPGIEITKGEWHFNALFLEDRNVTKNLEKKEALIAAKKHGAFVFWNHPGWQRPERWFPEIDPLWDSQLFSGIELVNGKTVYDGIYQEMMDKNLAILSNTDWHMPATEGDIEGRAITLVFARTADPSGIREALEARRTAAWMGGEVWGSKEMLTGLWEGAVKVENSSGTVAAGGSYTLRLSNSSAFEFRIDAAAKPEWLSLRGSRLAAQSGMAVAARIAEEAPQGSHEIDLVFKITNFHTGPGENLVVNVPLRLVVE